MRLVPISSGNVERIWPHIKQFMIAACKKGPCRDLDESELRVSCETGRHQLWIALGDDNAPIAASVTGIREDNGRRVAEWIAFGATDATSWQQFMQPIEQWAKQNECVSFRSYGRAGMKRLMPDGYRVKGYIFEKVL